MESPLGHVHLFKTHYIHTIQILEKATILLLIIYFVLNNGCYIEMIRMPKAPKLWVLKFPCYEFTFEIYTFKDLFQWCIRDPIWTTFITCTFVPRVTTFCDFNFWGDCILVVFFHFLLHHSLRFHVTPSKISIVQTRLNASFNI
jgi:hypothetical protein